MSEPVKTVSMFVQSLLLEQSPPLTAPDGRPLYGYRVKGGRYEDLRNRMRFEFRSLLGRAPAPRLAAGFVLYAAETWRRADDISRWNKWAVVLDELGGAEVHPPALYPVVRLGLDWWRRTLRTLGDTNRYIATLVCEGGLPMQLVRENGTPFRRYFRNIVAHVRDFGLEQQPLPLVALREAETLPRSLRQEPVYGLASDLVEQLWHIHKRLAGREEDPVHALDQLDVSWRDRLPLRLDDETARSLLRELLRDVREVVANRAPLPKVQRWLQEQTDGWQLCARIEVARSTSTARFAILFDGNVESVPAYARMAVATESAVQAQFGTAFNNAEVIHFEIAKRRRLEVDGRDASGRIDLDLDAADARWGRARKVAIPGGQRLSASQPWVFRAKDEETGHAGLLSDGGCRTRFEEVLVATPTGVVATPENASSWNAIGPVLGCDRTLHRCRGRVVLRSTEGDSWVVATAQAEDLRTEYFLDGSRFEHAVDSGPEIYRGSPHLRLRQDGDEVIMLPAHEKLWRPAHSRSAWHSGWEGARGMVDLRVLVEGETCLSRRVAILPPGFERKIDVIGPHRGTIRLRGTEAGTAIVNTVSGVHIEQRVLETDEGIDLHCETNSDPPASLRVRFEWPDNTPVDLTFPAPFRSAHFVTGDGNRLTRGYVALDDLFALRASVVTPHAREVYAITGQLRDRKGVEGASLSEVNRKLDLELPMRKVAPGCYSAELRHLVEPVRRAMRAVPELDLQVELRLEKGRVRLGQPRLDVQRYAGTLHCEWEEGWVEMATTSAALEVQKDSIGVRAFPLWRPRTAVVDLEPLPTATPTWLFDPPSRAAGPWVLYGHLHGVACTRPRLWIVSGESIPQGENAHERTVLANREAQEEERSRLYATLLAGTDQPAWDDLFALICHSTNLPVSSFDTVRMLVKHPATLVSCILRADSPELREAVFALREELPFEWSQLPLAAWIDGSRSSLSQLRGRYLEADLPESEVEELVREFCKRQLDWLPQSERTLRLVFRWVCFTQVPGLTCPPEVATARDPESRWPILGRLQELWMEARRRQAHEPGWPTMHGIDTWSTTHPQAVSVPYAVEGLAVPGYQSVARAPWVAASVTLSDSAPDPLLTLELLRARAFDAEWFDSAQECYMALAIAKFSDQIRPTP